MINITIAGAGAGKTTSMADRIIDAYNKLECHKYIYCIAFTNNASEHIKSKIAARLGHIPHRIKISTIHSFLYQEIIKPYYCLLYNRNYKGVSNIKLPEEPRYANYKRTELENKDLLHVTALTQRAKWVFVKKSGDKTEQKRKRKTIQKTFAKYCGAIFLDEAQDIDDAVLDLINAFVKIGICVNVVGDPKQDLKGFGNLRQMISVYEQSVTYVHECHRCPEMHIRLANSIIEDNEQQISKKHTGSLKLVFESDVCLKEFIEVSHFDLMYISEKNNRFNTQKASPNKTLLENLKYELECALAELHPHASEFKVASDAYFFANKLFLVNRGKNNATAAINEVLGYTRFNGTQYSRIIRILEHFIYDEKSESVTLNSIESIKGQEGKNCLFVLTHDLAKYLFKKKTENNKTKNKLYVALTRSLETLTVLITKEVESEFGKDFILDYLKEYIS